MYIKVVIIIHVQKDQIGFCKPGILCSFSVLETVTGIIPTEGLLPFPPFFRIPLPI